jgi:hypothetical protein
MAHLCVLGSNSIGVRREAGKSMICGSLHLLQMAVVTLLAVGAVILAATSAMVV